MFSGENPTELTIEKMGKGSWQRTVLYALKMGGKGGKNIQWIKDNLF